jgi:hypothetical protein
MKARSEEYVADQSEPLAVRVIYIVPADTEPWADVRRNATECLEDIQCFFADEMRRLHYEPKTFRIATDENNRLLFHQIDSDLKRDNFADNYWLTCQNEAERHKLRNLDVITIYFYEAYWITNNKVKAGARGDRTEGIGGEAYLSSLHLKIAIREWIANNNGYNGKIINWIRPEPMKEDTLSWNGRGRMLGDVSGSGFGMIAHELCHCFGVPPQEKMTNGRNGPLMGDGCRGMRGYFRSDLTDDRCYLRAQDAAALDKSEFLAVRDLK